MDDNLINALEKLKSSADELRALDAQLGDGDLGVTVSQGAQAVQEALKRLGDGYSLTQALMESGRAFGNANPSTFAALAQGGLLAAAKATRGASAITPETLRVILSSVAQSIRQRGKSEPGEKTVLDPLIASIDALDQHDVLNRRTFDDMTAAASEITDRLAAQPSLKGRAAWMGERSIGHKDPGSVAYVRFLEAVRDQYPEHQL